LGERIEILRISEWRSYLIDPDKHLAMMDSDEREIYCYLKSWQSAFLSAREISRRAGGKNRFREDEGWAKPSLVKMAKKGIIETDAAGHYRLKPIDKPAGKRKIWVSPQVAIALKRSGKDFSAIINDIDEMDIYSNSL
jgi:hypothetical protein